MWLSTLEIVGSAQLRSVTEIGWNHRSYLWIEAISGMVSAPVQKLSGIAWLNIDLTSPISIQFLERFLTERCNFHNLTGFYLGFIFWGRSPEWPKATSFLGGSGGKPPQKFFEMDMHWDAFWCILRHIFEKCYSVCNDLVVSRWFFQYSYLYTVVIIFFFWGGGGSWAFWGGSFYPSNTLDRTLP